MINLLRIWELDKKRLFIWLKKTVYLLDYQSIKYMNNLIQNYEIIFKRIDKYL